MIFIDASALVAIITREPDWRPLMERVEGADALTTSSIAIYETALAIARKKGLPPERALRSVARFTRRYDVEIVPVGAVEGRAAVDAHARYGKGRHPAALNMGDCFAYACAKLSGAELLYKGGDFDATDLATSPHPPTPTDLATL